MTAHPVAFAFAEDNSAASDGPVANLRRLGLRVDYTQDFFDRTTRSRLMCRLLDECSEGHVAPNITGADRLSPGICAAYGDSPTEFTVGGEIVPALPWTPTLDEIRARIADHTRAGGRIAFAWVTYGVCSGDLLSPAAESDLLSVSFGPARRLVFCPPIVNGADPPALTIAHGSLFGVRRPTDAWRTHDLAPCHGAPCQLRVTFYYQARRWGGA